MENLSDDYLKFCMLFLCSKGVVQNYEVSKEVARKHINGEIKIFFPNLNYNKVLQCWCKVRYTSKTENSDENIYFCEEKFVKTINQGVSDRFPDVNRININSKCVLCNIQIHSTFDFCDHFIDRQHIYHSLNSCNRKIESANVIVTHSSHCQKNSKNQLKLNSREEQIINLFIKNQSLKSYTLEYIKMTNKINGKVILKGPVLPLTLSPSSQTGYSLETYINESGLHVLRFNLKIVMKKTGKVRVFEHVIKIRASFQYNQNNKVRNCDSDKPPLKPVKAVKQSAVVGENKRKIISVKSSSRPDAYVLPLKEYPVPNYLSTYLVNGFKHKSQVEQTKILQPQDAETFTKMIAILKDSKGINTLTCNNYYDVLDLLLYLEDFQMGVEIKKYDRVTTDLVPCNKYHNRFKLKVPNLAEQRPSLLYGDFVFITPQDDHNVYRGIVRFVNIDSVILELNERFRNEAYEGKKSYSIRYGFNRTNIRQEHRSVELIKKHKAASSFFPKSVGTSDLNTCENIVWFNNKIAGNPEQRKVVLQILSNSAYPAPYLIFGPPGTGKTLTIIETIAQIWKLKPGVKTLICAPSNSVGNEIATRLIKYVPLTDIFRYISLQFNYQSIPPSIVDCTNYDDGEYYTPTLQELLKYRIIITTLSIASRLVSMGMPSNHFSYVFIDESGHATESETLLPVAGILTSVKNLGTLSGQLVLAGDPQQLGPITQSMIAKKHGFGISMLERMMTTLDMYKKDSRGNYDTRALTKLVCNYRSHKAILYLPNILFYDGELQPCGSGLTDVAIGWKHLPNPNIPIIFHNVIADDQREQNSPSYFNTEEVKVVTKYLNLLVGKRLNGMLINQEHIGVIAPYRKQVEKLRAACADNRYNDIEIGSVEQYQGQERLIIIITTVRSKSKLLKFDSRSHLGFLSNPKRFNVAITRSKALLIVVGNANLLQYEEYWRALIDYCREKRCFTGDSYQPVTKGLVNIELEMAKLNINDDVPDDSINFSRGNL